MAVVIRMKRAGAKKRPFFRVVVADSRYPRDGRYIEQLGYYDPLTDPATFKVDEGKFEQWIRRGARPSESVEVMMKRHAPQALRPAPLPKPAPEAEAETAAPAPEKPKRVRAAKPKAAAAKKKPRAPKKGAEKKAKARAKAKTRAPGGAAKPRAAKKAKK